MTAVRLRVVGVPAPQGSKRHVGGGRMIESSKKVQPWRTAIVNEAHRQGYDGLLIDDAVFFRVTFYLPRPKSHCGATGIKPSAPRWPTKVPDLDKLLRSTFDGLTQAHVIVDDARIVVTHARKVYADDEATGALIHLSTTEAGWND